MKTHPLLLALAIVWFTLSGLYAQNSCLPDGITFTSQAQIDSFPINYPESTFEVVHPANYYSWIREDR